jgi:predicted permease
MKEEGQTPPGRLWLRHAFVVMQIAGSLVVIVSAGLFVRALARAGSSDPGFEPRGVELASVDLTMGGYTGAARPAFARALVERVRRDPAVQAASLSRVVPGGFEGISLGTLSVPGGGTPDIDPVAIGWNIVEPGYFATLRIPLAAGRDFTPDDRDGAPPVVIVGESLARRLWPGQDPVGRPVIHSDGPDRTLTVVGVAREIKSTSLIDGMRETFVYLPLQQAPSHMTTPLTIVARSADGRRLADRLRTVVSELDRNLPIVSSSTLDESTSLGLMPQRIAASLSGSLGLVALILAGIGVYGVTAYTVARRTREFGIRLALGATTGDIVAMVLRQGLWLVVIGGAVGLPIAAVVSQVLAIFLYGVPPLDPVTFMAAVALFGATGLVACYGPARRATRVDPLAALRHE